MSPLRKTAKSTRIDLRIPDILLDKIKLLAIENDAPIHHISKKPELTGTIIDLLEKALSGNTSDNISDNYHDINIKQELETIKSDIESLKSVIFQPKNTLESLPDNTSDSMPDSYHDIDTATDDAIADSTDGLTTPQLSKLTTIPIRTLQNWKKKIGEGETVTPQDKKRSDFFDHWKLGDDELWYRKN